MKVTTSVVEVDHLFQRLGAAIVEVRSAQLDVHQIRRLEAAVLLGVPSDAAAAKVFEDRGHARVLEVKVREQGTVVADHTASRSHEEVTPLVFQGSQATGTLVEGGLVRDQGPLIGRDRHGRAGGGHTPRSEGVVVEVRVIAPRDEVRKHGV